MPLVAQYAVVLCSVKSAELLCLEKNVILQNTITELINESRGFVMHSHKGTSCTAAPLHRMSIESHTRGWRLEHSIHLLSEYKTIRFCTQTAVASWTFLVAGIASGHRNYYYLFRVVGLVCSLYYHIHLSSTSCAAAAVGCNCGCTSLCHSLLVGATRSAHSSCTFIITREGTTRRSVLRGMILLAIATNNRAALKHNE